MLKSSNLCCILHFGYLCGCSMEEAGDSNPCMDTDSDTAEKKDGTRCSVKWTQEEVSEKKSFRLLLSVRNKYAHLTALSGAAHHNVHKAVYYSCQ